MMKDGVDLAAPTFVVVGIVKPVTERMELNAKVNEKRFIVKNPTNYCTERGARYFL